MSWGWVYVIIAAIAVVMLVCYVIWLWHKATDVYAEVQVVGERAGRLLAELERLDLTPLEGGDRARGPQSNLVRQRNLVRPYGDDDPFDDDRFDEDPFSSRG